MHKVKAAQRRNEGRERASSSKKKDVDGEQKAGGCVYNIFEYIGGWLLSARAFATACFIFGMFGRFFHIFDAMLESWNVSSGLPAYMACPGIVLFLSITYIVVRRLEDGQSAPQIFTMVCCCGVLAGAIMEEQLEDPQALAKEIPKDDMIVLSFSCATFSFLIHCLDYHWSVPMRKLLLCFVFVVAPGWLSVLYHLMPWESLLPQTFILSFFTFATGIVDFASSDVRARAPVFTSVFPARFVGCLIQCFGMVALTTYYTSWRTNLFSESWFSFAWLVFAGVPLVVMTLTCHLIYWTSEMYYGPGDHNLTSVVKAVLLAWGTGMLVHHYEWKTEGFWQWAMRGTQRYKSEYGL